MLFLDEPFSALDFEMTLFIREKLQKSSCRPAPPCCWSRTIWKKPLPGRSGAAADQAPTRVAEILDYGDARPRTVETLTEPSFIDMKKLSLEIFQREVRR